ncbi:MAG: hypothetical protein ACRENE_29820 [Polyangiaceae bacterium]
MPPIRPLLLASTLCLSCGASGSDFRVQFAPGFAPASHTVSVFGVYKDGQMSAEAWDALSPRMAYWLGAGACRAGYVDGAAGKSDAPLWSAVDDYSRSNGPTDDLLAEIAPAAQGDLVMVVTVAGKVPAQEKSNLSQDSPTPSTSGATAGPMGGMRGGGGASPGMHHDKMMPAGSKDALDLAALLYSTSARKSVAEVSLEYTGHKLDDALSQFAAKLREALPGATCTGWTWAGKVDVDRIRKLGE